MLPGLEDLNSATIALSTVLDNYVNNCAKIRDHYFQERTTNVLDTILDRVANELQVIASYGTKLKQAEASLKVVRNSSPTIVPVSSLPPEVLTRIFRIALEDQPEIVDATRAPFNVSISFPKQPETISHVCFAWRQITLASQNLWTRIDLVIHHPLGPGFLARARAHVERAGKLPLEVYMVDPVEGRRQFLHNTPNEFEDFDFLTFGDTPMSSLNVVSYRGLQDAHYGFISYCIINCAQNTLKQLTIRNASDSGGPYCFIESADNQHGHHSLQISLSEQLLEGVWYSTSVLRLAGLYPYWTSQAYHQLVDLRLGSDRMGGRVDVSEVQIVNVLKASPGLRVFHLHLSPTDPLPDNAPILPIRLGDLESVNLSSFRVKPSQILRFIIPGQKSLQLSVFGQPTDVVEQFLKRSNVTQLRLVAWKNYPLINTLSLCPNLQKLVLDVWGAMGWTNFQTVPEQGDEPAVSAPTGIHLQSLYILRCEGIRLVDLQQIVKRHSVQELTLWQTYPTVRDSDDQISEPRGAYEFELSSLCPYVSYLGGRNRSPMDEWDLF